MYLQYEYECNRLAKIIADTSRLRSLDLNNKAIKLLAKKTFIIGDIQ